MFLHQWNLRQQNIYQQNLWDLQKELSTLLGQKIYILNHWQCYFHLRSIFLCKSYILIEQQVFLRCNRSCYFSVVTVENAFLNFCIIVFKSLMFGVTWERHMYSFQKMLSSIFNGQRAKICSEFKLLSNWLNIFHCSFFCNKRSVLKWSLWRHPRLVSYFQ